MAKIELTSYETKVTISDTDDCWDLHEWVEQFKSALRALSFTDDQIQQIKIEE